MKKIKWIFFVLIFLNLISCHSSFFAKKEASCYWMENYSGEFKWVSTQKALGKKYDKNACFEADSCDGGLGLSGGGCYKWANTADAPRIGW